MDRIGAKVERRHEGLPQNVIEGDRLRGRGAPTDTRERDMRTERLRVERDPALSKGEPDSIGQDGELDRSAAGSEPEDSGRTTLREPPETVQPHVEGAAGPRRGTEGVAGFGSPARRDAAEESERQVDEPRRDEPERRDVGWEQRRRAVGHGCREPDRGKETDGWRLDPRRLDLV